ncbi:hypothetical protein AGRO_2539 [Agrobacterium sp. ATCC 31749]|nr:hypothetical protein AGRO_2539 [Agrobacterium sp. ATCC 31749]
MAVDTMFCNSGTLSEAIMMGAMPLMVWASWSPVMPCWLAA